MGRSEAFDRSPGSSVAINRRKRRGEAAPREAKEQRREQTGKRAGGGWGVGGGGYSKYTCGARDQKEEGTQ